MEKKVSIAIIDDDVALASNLKDILEAEGYSVEAVHDGKAGIALFHEKMFDLGLMDITLPDIPGPELVSRLSRLRPETEYIMVTAHATMETAVEAVRQKQIIGYENKPVDMEHLLTFIREVMRRRLVAERLRESEEKYRTLFESSRDAIMTLAPPTWLFTTGNPATVKLFTVKDEAEFISIGPWQLSPERQPDGKPSDEKAKEMIETAIRNGSHFFEWTHCHSDGTPFPAEVLLTRMEQRGKVLLQATVRNITDRKQAEEEKTKLEAQLHQAQKMEAIATLAGGVAHEFNNALMGIMGNIELLKIDLPEDERRAKYFEAMKGSGHRMSRLTDQLLAYAQGGKYQPKNLKLDDFVIETLPILQHDLSPEVRVETYFPKDIMYIKADHTQMQMVLSAILANSNEAIEDEGLIKITAENKDIDEDLSKQHPGLKPGSYVCLTIKDDGKGMDEKTKNGIFDPFFTTKFQGRGMGMAAVYGIVINHGGWITVDSEPGKGTAIEIYLPAVEAEAKEKKVKAPAVKIITGTGTILVIEDEEMVMDVLRAILERLGYRILEAKTGKEAIGIAKTFDGQIDLALLDIKLPDTSGDKLYPLIMEARPDLKVIVCSGYSIDGPAQGIIDAGAQGFIQKPFSVKALSQKLREILDKE